MARDYEDFSSIEDLDDAELRQLVRDRLADQPNIDSDDITVVVEHGTVRLEGRVGTESELRIAEHILTDVVGVVDYDNALVVDALNRVETSEDIDEHLNEERRSAGTLFGGMPPQQSDTAEVARGDEDLEQRMFGTTNVQDAIAHGTPYTPPDSPTPEGLGGTDTGPGGYGEDH